MSPLQHKVVLIALHTSMGQLIYAKATHNDASSSSQRNLEGK